MLKIEDWMNKKVDTCSKDTTVIKATKDMMKSKAGALVVIDQEKKPIGLVSQSDVIKKVVLREKDPSTLKVEDIMSKRIETIDVNSPLIQLSQQMHKKNIRKMPVTRDGKLVGMITARDLIRIMSGI